MSIWENCPIGYGNIVPQSNAQTFFTIIAEIMGAAIFGFVIGNVANISGNRDKAKIHYAEKLEKINTFMHF